LEQEYFLTLALFDFMVKKGGRGLAVGFDETNNGFSIPHAPFMIITGCIGYDGRGYGTPCFGSKSRRKFFGREEPSREEIVRCALGYLLDRDKFLYSVIPKSLIKSSFHANLLKAQAISAIFLRYVQDGRLPDSAPIYIHSIDGPNESSFVESIVRDILGLAGIDHCPVSVLYSSKGHCPKKEVVERADMTGYYLASIKFLLKPSRWPFRDRRVYLDSLETRIFERMTEIRE
jgi:hypothetical protein